MTRTPLFGLVGSYFVSQIGTAMSGVAIPWLVLVSTGSAAKTGLVGFAEMAPYVLLQATSGPLADRIGLHRTTVAGNAIAAILVCAIPALSAAGLLNIGVLCLLVAAAGATRGTADAAMSPLVPGTAKLAEMPMERAAGLYSAANRTGLLVGLPAAGGLIALTTPATVVLLDGISFAVAAVGIAAFVPATAAAGQKPDSPLSLRAYARDLREGLAFLWRDRLLLGMATMIALTNLYDQALSSVLLPVWVRNELGSPSGLGIVGGALSLGLLGGVLLGAWVGHRLPRYWTYAVGFLVSGAPLFFVLAAAGTLLWPTIVAFLCGVSGGALNPIIGAVMYERVPDALQARVLGMTKAGAWLGIPFGSLLGGGLVAAAGLDAALIAFGAAMLITTLAPFVFPAWRGMDRAPTDSSQVDHDSVRDAIFRG